MVPVLLGVSGQRQPAVQRSAFSVLYRSHRVPITACREASIL